MPDALSPLERVVRIGHFGAQGETPIGLHQRVLPGLWQLAGWDGFDTAAKPALAALGLPGLGDYRRAQTGDACTAWRIAPDRLLVETAAPLARFVSAELAVLDLGHARASIEVSGLQARTLLAQVTSADVSEPAFKPGQFLQTGVHQVGVLLHCREEYRFELLVPSTWVESVWELLQLNALPFGVEVREG